MRTTVNRSLTVAAGLLVLLVAPGATRALPPSPSLATRVVRIPMRDGVELATDIYLPDAEASGLPCILIRTPYGRTRYDREFGSMARWGYAVAIQDTRGRFDSDGVPMAFQDDGWRERQDGRDTVEWLARQPFTNGRIGTLGASAMGITQLQLAPTRALGLTCQYVLVAAADLYHHATYQGGVLREHLVEEWLKGHAHPDALELVREHPGYDDHWKSLDALAEPGRINVPILHFGGWYDIFSQGTLDAFRLLQERGGPGARGHQKLVMGPWVHGGPETVEFGDVELPPTARRVPHDISPRRWFDYHLRGRDNGIDALPPVIYYVLGPLDGTVSSGNVWRTADRWPPLPTSGEIWHLAPGGQLLATVAPEAVAGGSVPVSFVHDPLRPVPTLGGRNLFLPAGPVDQRPVEARDDVLVFTSAPLEEEIEVCGRVRAWLRVSVGAGGADLAVRLCDVYPDGRSLLVCDGIRRVRSAGVSPQTVDVDLWSICVVLAVGHRLRVSVAGSNAPRFEVHGAGPGDGTDGRSGAARVTLHLLGGDGSRLVVPTVDPSDGPSPRAGGPLPGRR